MGARIRSCCDLVLAGKSVEDRSAANLVPGQVDHVWGLGLGLGRCELRQCSVRPRGIEVMGIVKLLADEGFRGSFGSDGVVVALWSGGCWSQAGDLVPGGESGGHLVSVLDCGESVAAGPEMG